MKLILVALLLVLPCQAMTHEEFSLFQAWLDSDDTDKNMPVNITFDCLAFSTALASNATNDGQKDIYMANVQAPQYPGGHWINAVLVDGEYIFIEPQSDVLIDFENTNIIIVDNSMTERKELIGKNKITVTGNMLIPIKTPK